jgi:AcrR family transcriptional regulator
MSRPSRNLDRKLIDAARRMLPDTGFSGLKAREVARRADVNLGMFHYYFKSRDAFLRRVLEETYGNFLVSFRETVESGGTARERLRGLLIAAARFARDNRVFCALMVRELLGTEPRMMSFAKANFPPHVSLLAKLIEDCRREGDVRPLATPILCMFAMESMVMPAIAVASFERSGVRAISGVPLRRLHALFLSDEMITQRAEMVMAALAAGGGNRRAARRRSGQRHEQRLDSVPKP